VSRALIVSGASGVGKSIVAGEISRALAGSGTPCAFVDVDTIAQFGPAPWHRQNGESFHDMLKCRNVGSLWLNFRNAGAICIVVAADVGSLPLRTQYENVLEGCALQVALLTAPPDLLKERLARRQRDPFHSKLYSKDGTIYQEVLERVAADQARLQTAGVHDFDIINDALPAQTSAKVLELAGWLT
jgi:hypothetical protein